MKTGSARPNQQPYRNKNYSISNFGSTLADLKDLEMMQLQWIFFNSPIPSAWGNSFSDNLTVITVNDCNLESSIPSNLGDIGNLQHLDLQSNYLTGTIPQQLCNLRHLVYLDVSYNDLQSGAVPSCLNKPGLYLSTGDQEAGLSPNHGARSQHIITSTFFLSSFLGASASILLLFLVN
jgi:Leucine-rich repeat (LRR) protein